MAYWCCAIWSLVLRTALRVNHKHSPQPLCTMEDEGGIAGTDDAKRAIHCGEHASQARPGPGRLQSLFSFEVFVHHVACAAPLPKDVNVCLAFRLWQFPTLFVFPSHSAACSGGARGLNYSYAAPPAQFLTFDSGKSCLFQMPDAELQGLLPLPLQVTLASHVSDAERLALGSGTAIVGEPGPVHPLVCTPDGQAGLEGFKFTTQRASQTVTDAAGAPALAVQRYKHSPCL